jgi:hypothetical protein
LLLTFSFCRAYGQRFATIRSGDFFSDSVWASGIQPNLSSDSIYVRNDLTYDRDISLSGTSYMYIKSCARLCSNNYILLKGASSIYNAGSIFTDSILDEGTIINNGYIDVAGKGMTVDSGGSYYGDSLGYLYGHIGVQNCLSPIIAIDSNNWVINQEGGKLNVQFYLPYCFKEVDFGDGYIGHTDSNTISHYLGTFGTFLVTIKVFYMCDTFIQSQIFTYDTFYFCSTPTVFAVYPNPCSDHFYLKYQSCLSGTYTLPVYDLLGQKVKEVIIDNTGTPILVDMGDVVNGLYVIKAPTTVGKSVSEKLVVLH